MNGIRIVQKGDAPKEGITSVQASADSVVLDDDFEPIVPGSGKVGRVARGGNIPLGYYNDPVKTAEVFVTDAQGKRWSIPGDFATVEADGRITLLGRGSRVDQLGWREGLSRRGRGRAEVASRRVRRARRRRPRRTVGRAGHRAAAAPPGPDADARRRCRRTAAARIAGYKVPRELFLVDEVPRLPERQARLPHGAHHCQHARGPDPGSTRLASRRNPHPRGARGNRAERVASACRCVAGIVASTIGAALPPTPRTCSG